MHTRRGDEGAALVTALLLTLLSLMIATALLYSVTMGTRATASQKRYKTALSSAYGGVDVVAAEVIPRLWENVPLTSLANDYQGISLSFPPLPPGADNAQCLQQKLRLPTRQWQMCATQAAALPDVTFTLGAADRGTDFTISAKILDTIPGNTDTAGPYLDLGLGVAGSDEGTQHPQHQPYLYNIDVAGERGAQSPEKAKLSVLYAY